MSEILEVINAEDLVQEEYRRLYPGEHPGSETLERAACAVAEALSSSLGNGACGDNAADTEMRMHDLGLAGVFVHLPRELIDELGLAKLLDHVNNYLAWELDVRMSDYRAGRPQREDPFGL